MNVNYLHHRNVTYESIARFKKHLKIPNFEKLRKQNRNMMMTTFRIMHAIALLAEEHDDVIFLCI